MSGVNPSNRDPSDVSHDNDPAKGDIVDQTISIPSGADPVAWSQLPNSTKELWLEQWPTNMPLAWMPEIELPSDQQAWQKLDLADRQQVYGIMRDFYASQIGKTPEETVKAAEAMDGELEKLSLVIEGRSLSSVLQAPPSPGQLEHPPALNSPANLNVDRATRNNLDLRPEPKADVNDPLTVIPPPDPNAPRPSLVDGLPIVDINQWPQEMPPGWNPPNLAPSSEARWSGMSYTDRHALYTQLRRHILLGNAVPPVLDIELNDDGTSVNFEEDLEGDDKNSVILDSTSGAPQPPLNDDYLNKTRVTKDHTAVGPTHHVQEQIRQQRAAEQGQTIPATVATDAELRKAEELRRAREGEEETAAKTPSSPNKQ